MTSSDFRMVIHQPSLLTLAEYRFSALQKDVIYHILAKIERETIYTDRTKRELWPRFVLYLPLKEFAPKEKWKDVMSELKELGKKHILYTIKEENKPDTLLSFPPIDVIRYSYEDSEFKITVNERAVSYYSNLGKGFTKYQLMTALSLSSPYTKRLYELCCHWREKGVFSFFITELRSLFGIADKYSKIADLKEGILHPAQEELKSKADVWFEYTLSKKKEERVGRPSFDMIHFKVLSKESEENMESKFRLMDK